MIHIGVVTAVNYQDGTVRVKISDLDDFVTGPLIVFQGRTKDTKDYYMPDIDEMGLVILLPHGGSHGFYLGSGYSKNVPLPEGAGKGKRIVVFDDGTRIEYDKEGHKLTVECVGSTKVTAAENIEFIANNVMLKGTSGIVFDGAVTHNNGDYINPEGDVKAGEITLKTHKTKDVEPGSGTSGLPTA